MNYGPPPAHDDTRSRTRNTTRVSYEEYYISYYACRIAYRISQEITRATGRERLTENRLTRYKALCRTASSLEPEDEPPSTFRTAETNVFGLLDKQIGRSIRSLEALLRPFVDPFVTNLLSIAAENQSELLTRMGKNIEELEVELARAKKVPIIKSLELIGTLFGTLLGMGALPTRCPSSPSPSLTEDERPVRNTLATSPKKVVEDSQTRVDIPPLQPGTEAWLSNLDAAKFTGVKPKTLGTYRRNPCARWIADDGMSGIDKDGRKWRRNGTKNCHPYYYSPSLVRKTRRK